MGANSTGLQGDCSIINGRFRAAKEKGASSGATGDSGGYAGMSARHEKQWVREERVTQPDTRRGTG